MTFEGSCFLETNWLWWVVTGSEHSVIKPTVHYNDTLYLIIITLKLHVIEGQTLAHLLIEKFTSYRKGATVGYHKNTSSLGMPDQVEVEIWSSSRWLVVSKRVSTTTGCFTEADDCVLSFFRTEPLGQKWHECWQVSLSSSAHALSRRVFF